LDEVVRLGIEHSPLPVARNRHLTATAVPLLSGTADADTPRRMFAKIAHEGVRLPIVVMPN
jgi:hypothetical protein